MRTAISRVADGRGKDLEVEFVVRGERPAPDTIAYARRKILAAARAASAPPMVGRVTLTVERHRAIERPAMVDLMLDVGGRTVFARATARSLREAVDLAEGRLRRRLADARGRKARRRRDGGR